MIYCCTATVSGGKVQVIPQQLAVFNVKNTAISTSSIISANGELGQFKHKAF